MRRPPVYPPRVHHAFSPRHRIESPSSPEPIPSVPIVPNPNPHTTTHPELPTIINPTHHHIISTPSRPRLDPIAPRLMGGKKSRRVRKQPFPRLPDPPFPQSDLPRPQTLTPPSVHHTSVPNPLPAFFALHFRYISPPATLPGAQSSPVMPSERSAHLPLVISWPSLGWGAFPAPTASSAIAERRPPLAGR
jgi:hypothetical protein